MRGTTRLAGPIAIILVFGLAVLPAGADWGNSQIDDIIAKMNATKSNVDEMVGNVRSGVNNLTGTLRQSIDEAVADLKQNVQRELDGRDEFLGAGGNCGAGSECYQFRGDMVQLLVNIQDLTNALFDVTPADVQFELQRTIDLIEQTPGRVLFPLYRALASDSRLFESGFVEMLGDLALDIRTLDDGLKEGPAGAATSLDTSNEAGVVDLTECATILANIDLFTDVALKVTGGAAAAKLIGKGLIAWGETTAEGDAGIHGYVHVTLKNNTRKKIGGFVDGIADLTFAFSSYAHTKIRYCTVREAQSQILANQQTLQDGQAEILEAIRNIGPPWGSGAQGNGPQGNSGDTADSESAGSDDSAAEGGATEDNTATEDGGTQESELPTRTPRGSRR